MYLYNNDIHEGIIMFIGREKEVKELKEAYASDCFEAVLIYGRRRIGKSEIIKESLKDEKGCVIHFECSRTSLDDNLKELTKLTMEHLNLPDIRFPSFYAYLSFVFQRAREQKIILVIDEFSFLLENNLAIESDLARAIDLYKNDSKLKIVLCGSYVNLMEKMLEATSHCFGRFTHVLCIRPFNYYDSAKFYPNYTNEDKIIAYSVFGGVAYFNSLIDTAKSIFENIYDLIIRKDSILELELTYMILMETSKISNLNLLIKSIADGYNKYTDIASILKQNKNSRPEYLLKKLIDMDIIETIVPINDKKNRKKTFYQFKDNLMDFYYRFVFGSRYSFLRDNPALFFEKTVKDNFFEKYLPAKFETISKEFLIRKNLLGEINPPFMDIGTYSFNDKTKKINRQFDLVTLDEKGYIAYECKYKTSPIDHRVVNEETRQTASLENMAFYKLGFISKSGFTDDIDRAKYNCFSLSDFYEWCSSDAFIIFN